MEENKFERQVQQKMDELKILPSDSVWKKIEVRLEKGGAQTGDYCYSYYFFVFPLRRVFAVEYRASTQLQRVIILKRIILKKAPMKFR